MKFFNLVPRYLRFTKPLKRWVVIIFFTSIGPILILFFRLPGSKPTDLPILNVHNMSSEAFPLVIEIDEKFNVKLQIDFSTYPDSIWETLPILLPNGTKNIRLVIRNEEVILNEKSQVAPYTSYSTGQITIFLIKENIINFKDKLQLANNKEESILQSVFLNFELGNSIINHSFSNKSLVLFYLPMAGNPNATAKREVKIGLQTPIDLILNNSIPEAERILPFKNMIYYDFEMDANDSGLLFNFNDTSRSILEEIILFITSGVFGFLSGFLVEKLLLKI